MQLADLARRNGAAARRDQTRLDPGNQRADGVVAPRGPNAGNRGGTFGDTVGVAQRQPEFRLDLDFSAASSAHRRRPAAEACRGVAFDTSDCLVLQQPLIRGGHTEDQRDAIIDDRGYQCGRIITRHQLHSGTDHQ